MTPFTPPPGQCHVLRDIPSVPSALFALGDAGFDCRPLLYISRDDAPRATLFRPQAECHVLRDTLLDEDLAEEIAFAADLACPSPDRCRREGCRGVCHPPAA